MPRKGQFTLESWMIVNGKAGESFYSNKKDREITAISSVYKRKIKTERLITVKVGGNKLTTNYVTRVTLL